MARSFTLAAVATAAALSACGGSDNPAQPSLPPATGAVLSGACADLKTTIAYANTTITKAEDVAAGVEKVAGRDIPAHCVVEGSMLPRTSPVDGKAYAIGFQMRLPLNWNGRYFYQANGGIDGNVAKALGPVGGGGPLDNALRQGFAVISSDAGHPGSYGPFFGLDPQARLDYGYQAAAKLTPMAKSVIKTAYGKAPDRSYFGGCSNGGRHTMVAATRLADQYDGFLVGDPGFRLPLAAIANMRGAQVYASLATDPADIGTGFTQAERTTVSNAVLAKCDALDGVKDGIVQDGAACQAAFSLDRDVPTCTGARDGTCLTTAQKAGIGQLFAGATTSRGVRFYSSFPWDTGLYTNNWGPTWKFGAPLSLDPGGVAFIWGVPPESPAGYDGRAYALNGNVDTWLAKVNATDATYTESAMSFMTPPDAANLGAVYSHGGKVLVYHGTADPIFSSDDTLNWYKEVTVRNADARSFARYYPVPGMNHCSGGPATDQFDMLTPLVQWVENGAAPEAIVASARGAGNAGGANADVPASWAANRTRPLCPWPKVARYKGSGSLELAENFSCQ
jgi:feruloyl esterase